MHKFKFFSATVQSSSIEQQHLTTSAAAGSSISIHLRMSAPHLPPVGPDATTPSPLQETTVSADLLVDSGGGEDKELLSLTSIFHCPFIKESANSAGKTFTPKHHSRAPKHVLKIRCGDIAICSSVIAKNYEDRYHALYVRNTEQTLSKKCSHTQIDDALMMTQSSVANLLEKCGVVASGGAYSSSSMSIHSALLVKSSIPITVGAEASYSSIATSMRGSIQFALSSQPSISASIRNMDIRKSHNATVEMAIADFFHCENIPDADVESPRFKRLVKVCCLAGDD
jgi:hypothetical protein